MSLSKGAVIVETRDLKGLSEIIRDHVFHLPEDWGLTIFHSSKNSYLKNEFPEANCILIPDEMTIAKYNELLTSEWFWTEIPYHKVLIFQSDSMLLREGIEEFLEWDYIGAPWTFQKHGGNGGLSLRTKQVMLDIVKHIKYRSIIHGNEDLYFSKYVDNLAPREECEKFSVEAIFKLGTLGYHAIEKHLSPIECNLIKTQYE